MVGWIDIYLIVLVDCNFYQAAPKLQTFEAIREDIIQYNEKLEERKRDSIQVRSGIFAASMLMGFFLNASTHSLARSRARTLTHVYNFFTL
jgi:hypothetical protein